MTDVEKQLARRQDRLTRTELASYVQGKKLRQEKPDVHTALLHYITHNRETDSPNDSPDKQLLQGNVYARKVKTIKVQSSNAHKTTSFYHSFTHGLNFLNVPHQIASRYS